MNSPHELKGEDQDDDADNGQPKHNDDSEIELIPEEEDEMHDVRPIDSSSKSEHRSAIQELQREEMEYRVREAKLKCELQQIEKQKAKEELLQMREIHKMKIKEMEIRLRNIERT